MPGWTIEAHTTYLKRRTPDDRVAAFCGPKRWGLVTFDDMRYTPETKLALYAFKVRLFKITTGKTINFTEVQARLVLARPKIIEILRSETEALCAHVRQNGDVVIMNRLEEYRHIQESRLRTIRNYTTTAEWAVNE